MERLRRTAALNDDLDTVITEIEALDALPIPKEKGNADLRSDRQSDLPQLNSNHSQAFDRVVTTTQGLDE